MGIILIPVFLLNVVFVIFVGLHLFAMQSLNPTDWQNAILWGGGISLVVYLPSLISKSSSSGAQEAQETGETWMALMVLSMSVPSILVFVFSFFPASFYWIHFAECVLGAFAVGSLIIFLLMFFLFPIVFDYFKSFGKNS